MSKNPNSSSVYRNQNAKIRAIFERANNPRHVLCVAIDYSKTKHLDQICDGNGDILKKHFVVENNKEGAKFLIDQIDASANRRKIPRNQIFIGGEDCPSYVVNFLELLRAKDFLVVRVNARRAKRARENSVASTDALDLLGIAKVLLSRRANLVNEDSNISGVYRQIRNLMRNRRIYVRDKTACANRIHTLTDELFPGFLNPKVSGLTPFSDSSLSLMEEGFSAPRIARRHQASLAKFLMHHRTQDANETAAKLIASARNALPVIPAYIDSLQVELSCQVQLYRCLQEATQRLVQEAAQLLATTPYAMLTSIQGIGITLAAALAGELGQPSQLRLLDSLCAYAGVVPRLKQTGGPDAAGVQLHSPRACNRILKDYVLQSAQLLRNVGPPEQRQRIAQWEQKGMHSLYATARHYLRLVKTLVTNECPYLDPAGRALGASMESMRRADENAWAIMQRKWRKITGGLELMLDSRYAMGFWRLVVKDLHHVDLPEVPIR